MIKAFQLAHPGEILQDRLGGMSITEVARHLGFRAWRYHGCCMASPAFRRRMSLKLPEALGTSPDLWFKMQPNYDFWLASRKKRKKVARLKWAA